MEIDYWHDQDPINEIEEYLSLCGIDKRQIGIVAGPRLNEEISGIDLEVNIRVLGGEDEAIYAIDGIYSFKEMTLGQFMDEVYPEFVEELEESFSESQLHYYTPGI